MRYEHGIPVKVEHVVVSAQHNNEVDSKTVQLAVLDIVHKCVPRELLKDGTRMFINPPTGRFSFGGPAADTGLTGRKIISDTYGPSVPHGGGALSGKDPTKIDRCAAYAARYVAKHVVAAGLAKSVEVDLAYCIGEAEPLAVIASVHNGKSFDNITEFIRDTFDLTPESIIRGFQLKQPLYFKAAQARHFGMDERLPWETPQTGVLMPR